MIRPDSQFEDRPALLLAFLLNHGATTLFDGSYQDRSALCGAPDVMRDDEVGDLIITSFTPLGSPTWQTPLSPVLPLSTLLLDKRDLGQTAYSDKIGGGEQPDAHRERRTAPPGRGGEPGAIVPLLLTSARRVSAHSLGCCCSVRLPCCVRGRTCDGGPGRSLHLPQPACPI
jgi:hypothetical protein